MKGARKLLRSIYAEDVSGDMQHPDVVAHKGAKQIIRSLLEHNTLTRRPMSV